MCMRKARRLCGGVLAGLVLSLNAMAVPEGPGLGMPATAADVAERDISVFADGSGLPAGSGRVQDGINIYAAQCQACHGPRGIGGTAEELVGNGRLDGPNPDKSVGNYWPYATTLFDFIRRSMPLHAPRSLRSDEVYALTAYLLYLNGIIAADAVMNAETLKAVLMPNRDGFVSP